jgi:hypothetical protein
LIKRCRSHRESSPERTPYSTHYASTNPNGAQTCTSTGTVFERMSLVTHSLNVSVLTPLTAILLVAQHPLTTAVLFQIPKMRVKIKQRRKAGYQVNPGGAGGKYLEGGGGGCLQQSRLQAVVSLRRMA